MKNNSEKIIRLFLSSKVTDKVKPLFGTWLLSKYNQNEKDAALKKIWDETTVFSCDTEDSLNKVSDRLFGKSQSNSERRRSIYVYMTAAILAVIAIPVALYNVTNIREPQMADCRTGYGETKTVTLPDGSIIKLNSGSILIFPEKFSRKQRSVYLSGEAFFDISHNSKSRFSVHTTDFDVTVTGTKFNISSYVEDKTSSIYLQEGSVIVTKEDSGDQLYLKPNETLSYNRIARSFSDIQKTGEDITDWTDNDLLFRSAGIEEVIKRAERYFDIEISYSDSPKFREAVITARFSDRDSPEYFLSVLQKLIPEMEYSISGRHVFLQ